MPDYVCEKEGIEPARPDCQSIHGEQINPAISDLLIQAYSGNDSVGLDVALTVQQEVHTRMDELDRLRHKQVKRVRDEADWAQRRYLHVDPAHRLGAEALEACWNSKLQARQEAQDKYERLRQAEQLAFD